jgi:hypothetical protein
LTSEAGSPRCLNCGAELTGSYCSQCGQEDTELRVSLKRLAKDFIAEQLGLESKVPTTLWTLIRHPGRLTKEYLAGRRVRSLLPLRLDLSASVVYFLLLSFFGGFKGTLKLTNSDRAAIDSSNAEGGFKVTTKNNRNPIISFGGIEAKNADSIKAQGEVAKFVKQRARRFDGMSGQDMIKFFNDAFMHYLPNAIFVLLPVFTALLYLLYRKSGRFFAEHLIFTLHIHAFAFIALIIALFTPDALDWIAPVWILFYLYFALKTVYGETRRRTLGKFAALLFSYMFIFQVAMLSMLGLIFAFG